MKLLPLTGVAKQWRSNLVKVILQWGIYLQSSSYNIPNTAVDDFYQKSPMAHFLYTVTPV